MTAKAVPTLQIDNDRVRVTEWRFAKGAATGYHRHEYDYVVVPGTTGRLKIVGPDGSESVAELTAGQSTPARPASSMTSSTPMTASSCSSRSSSNSQPADYRRMREYSSSMAKENYKLNLTNDIRLKENKLLPS
jgi:hypothetical protein